ncbi:MAG: efflux transporter outer membrane subunit [Neisseria sp.]|uniref:efflux transporter outer membrane subunit n=1 Tax=Neisseria sp. TaxID=192066 RepID=UPI0026DC3120|nr:efflux transporter outer membrane subunit [Neisseria sp.]MDO4641653.1 efflux transporter outer membrane subunit [Neisseria sp.]
MKVSNIKSSLGIIVLCLLAGCAKPLAEVPLASPSVHPLPEGQTFAARENWWLALKDAQLNRYVELALKNAPSLRNAQARFDQIQAELGILDAADKAQVGIGANGVGTLLSKRPPSSFAQSDRSLLLAQAAVQAKWSFDFWGKNKAQIEAALGRQNAVHYEARQTEILLANAVVAQYFAWQNMCSQQDILNQRIDNSKQIEKLLQDRIRAQILAPSAVYAQQQAGQQLMLAKQKLDQEAERVRHGLAVLIGQMPNALDGKKPLLMPEVPNVRVDGLKADLLGKRPDIAAQRELLNMRSQNIRAAKADFYPNVELKFLAGLSHIDAFNLVRSNSGMLGALPSVNLPIFTGGALRSQLAKRRAEFDEQVAVYDQTVLDAMRMAADAISDYQSLKTQYAMAQQVAEIGRKISASALRRVTAGLENKMAYYQKQDGVLAQQSALSDKQMQVLVAWSNLHAQLGGGFEE